MKSEKILLLILPINALLLIFIFARLYFSQLNHISPDSNLLVATVQFFITNNYFNKDDINLNFYPILPAKIVTLEMLILNFFLNSDINNRDIIIFLFRLNNLLAAGGIIINTYLICKKINIRENILYFIPCIYFSLIIFQYAIIEVRNDLLLVFFFSLITFLLLESQNFSYKKIFLLGFFSACSLATREVSFILIVIIQLNFFLLYLKKKKFKVFILKSVFYLFITFVIYIFIIFGDFQNLLNSFLNHDFNKPNISKQLFFMSFDGTKYYSIFWYLNYLGSSTVGILSLTISFFGFLLFLGQKNFNTVKINLILIPLLYSIVICFVPVHNDRYAYPLIPFIVIFFIVFINIISNSNFNYLIKNQKFIIYLLILLINFKSILWFSTFFEKSTKEKAFDWIYKNVEKKEIIFFYNMGSWESKKFEKIKSDYIVLQYLNSDIISFTDLVKKAKVKYVISGENGLSYYYSNLYPFNFNNKTHQAEVLNNSFRKFQNEIFINTEMLVVFYNKIYQSGFFSAKFYDPSDTLKNAFQPIITISKVKN